MIEMSVSDDDHCQLLRLNFIKEREGLFSALVNHESTIKHDFLIIDSENKA